MKGDFGAAANRLESAYGCNRISIRATCWLLPILELKNPVPAGVIFDEMQASSLPSASMHVLIGLAYRKPAIWIKPPFILPKPLNLNLKNHACIHPSDSPISSKGLKATPMPVSSSWPNFRITPDDSNSRYYLGMIAAREAKADEAEKWFEQLPPLSPMIQTPTSDWARLVSMRGTWRKPWPR